VKVTISPGVMVLIPAISQPPARSIACDMLPPQRLPRPNGSDQTELVVLLYGWL
jgi:hypothetical protein